MNNKLLISVFLLGIAMLCPLVASDLSQTSVDIGNVAPTVGTVTVSPSPIVIAENSTVNVTCWAWVNDTNGWEDIETANGVLYQNKTTSACGADPVNCYTNATCSHAGGSGNIVNTSCKFTVQFYAQSTIDEGTWKCYIHVIDNGTSNANNQKNVSVSDTLALAVTSDINFGSMIVGEISLSDKIAIVTNTGNVRIDVNLNGTNMTCDVLGNILPGYIHYNDTAAQAWSTGCPLTTDPANTYATFKTTFDLAEGAVATKNSYWRLSVPTGVSGTCDGLVTFEAVKG